MAMRKPKRERHESGPNAGAERDYDPLEYDPTPGPKFEATVREDGSFTIPERVRKLMNLEAGDNLELELTFAGLIVRPLHPGRDPEQWWIYSDAWQRGEPTEEPSQALREERHVFMTFEEFLAELDSVDEEDDPKR